MPTIGRGRGRFPGIQYKRHSNSGLPSASGHELARPRSRSNPGFETFSPERMHTSQSDKLPLPKLPECTLSPVGLQVDPLLTMEQHGDQFTIKLVQESTGTIRAAGIHEMAPFIWLRHSQQRR